MRRIILVFMATIFITMIIPGALMFFGPSPSIKDNNEPDIKNIPKYVPLRLDKTKRIIHIPKDYKTIQEGIDAAVNGEIALVAPGTYNENVDFHGKNIVVVAEAGPEKTTINGRKASSVVTFRSGETGGAVLYGFKITNGLAENTSGLAERFPFGGGISIRHSSPTIKYSVITHNASQVLGGGISIDGNDARPLIEKNVISHNIATERGGGIEIREGAAPDIKNNLITGNISMDGAGIEVINRSSPVIEGNTISDNIGGYDFEAEDAKRFLNGLDVMGGLGRQPTIPGGILITYHSSPRIRNNTIAGNDGGGIGVILNSAPTIENNNINNNSGVIAGGILIDLNSAPTIKKNSIKKNVGAAIWSDSTSLYSQVNNQINGSIISWPLPPPKHKKLLPGHVLSVPGNYRTIQTAIKAANDGDAIIVSSGIYRENLDFMGKRIIVRSQNPENMKIVESTIIEAKNPAPTIRFTKGENRDAAIMGFKIQNKFKNAGVYVSGSSPKIDRNLISGLKYHGIEINQPVTPLTGLASSPLITGNTINGNAGGIHMFFASPVISNNVLNGNTEGAISVWFSHPLIEKNRVENNKNRGIFADHYSQPIIKSNVITGNSVDSVGGGLQLDDSCNAIIDGNIFSHNSADGSGGGLAMILDSYPQITNNVFVNNNNGAIFVSSSQPKIVNNTFIGNGIMGMDKSQIEIKNSIFFNSEIDLYDGYSEAAVSYSIDNTIRWPGERNLLQNPLFAGKDDFHLLPSSPGIDVGATVDVESDLQGNKRPQGQGFDIGAYEYVR